MRKVAAMLLRHPHGQHWGYGLQKATGLGEGAVQPILRRMAEDGWLTEGWEDPRKIRGRGPRHYYELTDLGREQLAEVVASEPYRRTWGRRPAG